ncbi:MAG: hypothetical protein IT162_02985 [Bryobacterales bacterium]|nr:hypothetical protein [Bryobacterales bacterium]
MAFRDAFEAAAALLAACRADQPCDGAALDLLIADHSPVLFSHVIEPLCDSFEPSQSAAYVTLFARVIERVSPGHSAQALMERYAQVRRTHERFEGDAADVVVLSRVTLGADLAVTSVLLDAAKQRFPNARIHFAAPAKNFDLFDADPRLHHLPVAYQRHGSLAARIEAGLRLRSLLPPGALVIDPDSRLSQLGLLPVVADPARHLLFESRTYGGDGADSLATLAARWASSVLGVDGAGRYFHTRALPLLAAEHHAIAVSLGTGGNAAKQIAGLFEAELLSSLAAAKRPVVVDLGAGGEEEQRVRAAVSRLPGARAHRVKLYSGSFARFAATIAEASFYVGYDSSGQHAAAASGTPRATVFAGYANERFLARWRA